MTLKRLRQILKALGEDTRLRIVNLLKEGEFTVSELCVLTKMSQPSISKHLVRLRLLKIVYDRREGNFIYYGINKDLSTEQRKIIDFLFSEFRNVSVFEKDIKKIKLLNVK